ncbi:hypothetical protein ACKC9G_14220 [Pokkaliibacter sp. CJK22405]|uniref:hypothetical protein n=1 Tax=Pokkaliibacter sp. CJK22405 TaxID=3384615 RepID=UPI0039854B98
MNLIVAILPMPLSPTTDFRVIATHSPEDACPEIVLEHTPSRQQLAFEGAQLEGQFAMDNGFILLITDDVPFEERLVIYRLDQKLQVCESITLGAAYTPGIIGDLQILSASQLSFSFFNNEEVWVLELLAKPAWDRKPFQHPVRRTSGVFRRSSLRLYIKIEREQQMPMN